MLDLETLGTGDNATIISIGAVQFSRTEMGTTESLIPVPIKSKNPEFYQVINFASVTQGVIDGSTVKWWLQQDPSLIKDLLSQPSVDADHAFKNFSEWVDNLEHEDGPYQICLWSKSPVFDEIILKNAFKEFFIPWPFMYHAGRCVRTVLDTLYFLDVDINTVVPFVGSPHNSLDDAKHQAKQVQYMFSLLDVMQWQGV